MSTSSALVSVIVPAYNVQKYIVEAIESVLAQSYEDFELIVIDDGSTDETLALVEAFEDKRIIVKHQENAGVSAARNLGISLSSGEYITFLDADDMLPKESLGERVAYLDENPNISVVDGRILVKDEILNTTLRTYSPYYKGKLLPRLLALDSSVFFNVCYMFRKNTLSSVRFKEGMTHAEDLLFYIELSSQNDVMYGFVEKEIYYYRSGHSSTMTNLMGLELGYMELLKVLKKDNHISKSSYVVLKFKIMKMMFLSWVSKHKIRDAFSSISKIVWI